MTHCLMDYLNFCADVVSPVKTVRCYPNNKPWVTREVQDCPQQEEGCLQEQRQGGQESSTAGGETLCEGSQGQLQEKGGAEAERENNMREVWEGVRTITGSPTNQVLVWRMPSSTCSIEPTPIWIRESGTVRILFLDFSSAFNTIQPTLLRDKLSRMGVDPQLMDWISDYLTGRPQYVGLKDITS
ncbi:hypothetical protein L3Q82_021000 [Scortum barcoo]|uniref:Uncharacterized protein n=1 Tax=Scortum barcoo TaxID=214431 RepID=A0ACB8V9F2_9TELE|nr:hypothetical protein L3Q82_021000 [Scortum barcoo]